MNDMPKAPPLDDIHTKQAMEDMASVLREEELDLSWRQVCILLDNAFVRISSPVMQAGCASPGGTITSLNWTQKGAEFMGAGWPPVE